MIIKMMNMMKNMNGNGVFTHTYTKLEIKVLTAKCEQHKTKAVGEQIAWLFATYWDATLFRPLCVVF